MGTEILEQNLPADSFLRRNIRQHISSVFPSTTTAAMTTFYSGLSPAEHGWLGWSLYFKEFGRAVNLFGNQDSLSGLSLGEPHAAHTLLAYPTIFQRMAAANPGAPLPCSIGPTGIRLRSGNLNQIEVDNLDGLCAAIRDQTGGDGHGFTLAYWPEPDRILHDSACHSPEARQFLVDLDKRLQTLASQLSDTLLVISADHGQIDIRNNWYLNDYPDLLDCLTMPPSIESRAFACFVKAGRHEEFSAAFDRHFSPDYQLFSRSDIAALGLFGPGTCHPKISDFVGDFLAIASGRSLVRYRSQWGMAKPLAAFRGHHAGLSPAEMIVPLIIIET